MQSNEAPFDARQRDDEIHDLSPGSFRFVLVILIGLGILALVGLL